MTRFLSVAIAFILIPIFSQAYLGEQTGLRAQMRVQDSPSVVQMDEMTDTQGIVRQVRWSGPTRPDFKATLGPCYEFYQSEMKLRARARGPAVIQMENANCRIEVGGGMGRIHGQAQLK